MTPKHLAEDPDEEPLPNPIPAFDQSLYYRDTLREFDRGPHDPAKKVL